MKLEIDLPSGRWFKGEWMIRPKVHSFCVIIIKREVISADNAYWAQYIGEDMFFADGIDDVKMSDVEWWRPIDLPAEFKKAVKEGE